MMSTTMATTIMVQNGDSSRRSTPSTSPAHNRVHSVGPRLAQSPCEAAETCQGSCAAYGKVCPVAARRAAQAAVKAMEKLSKDSILFQEQPHFITIDSKDLMIGKKLGEGGFSVVKTVVLKSGEEQGQTFAIKYLKRKVMAQKRLFELGAADLATESMFLATLHHPHIIAYHGISNGSIESSIASGKECGFFIVIDFLHDTLEHKIVKWAEDANTHSGGLLYRMSHDYKHHRKVALQERLSVAWQIADVMEYLHSRNIIYRDLKPDNMGFDNQGNLKLFDFGLAKELKPNKVNSLGKYKLTGNTGSRRYMAPEVAKNLPYDQTVDIYSFGILLWEMCAMEKPFYGFSANQHMQQVVLGGGRPKLDTSHTQWWPVKLHWVLRKCWSEDSSQRPSFTVIKETLQDLIECKKELGSIEEEDGSNEILLSTSHPQERDGFAALKANVERPERAVTTSEIIPPPPGGFGAMKPLSKSERASTAPTKSHRKISLGGLLHRKHHHS